MNLKKRALHLGVVAGMVGSAFAIAAPAAHSAAPPLTPTCGVVLQGNIDPAGGNLPAGITPITAPNFAIAGNVSKGQDKTISDLNNSAAGAKRFATKLTISNTVTTGTPTVSVQWKNGPAGEKAFPAFKLDAPAEKGVISGIGGADDLGAQLGEVTAVPPVYNLVVPNAATSGTYTFAMAIPPNAFGPGVPPALVNIPFPASAFNSSAAVLQGTLTAVLTAAFAPAAASAVVTGTNFVQGTTNGNYTITLGGALAAGAPALALASTQTGTLATTALDDGSIWNGTRFGGIDPSISQVSDLGHGVHTTSGVFSSTGKAQNAPDHQLLIGDFPQGLIDGPTGANPHFSTSTAVAAALPVLSAIAGVTIPQQACGLGGLLVLFCAAEPGVVPATFSGLCSALLNPV